jgi:hypothetical protein
MNIKDKSTTSHNTEQMNRKYEEKIFKAYKERKNKADKIGTWRKEKSEKYVKHF